MLETISDALQEVPEHHRKDALMEILKKMLTDHKRILFNGNGYTDEWVEEAAKRGLANLRSLPEAMPSWISEKSLSLFTRHGILTRDEMFSRYEILLENYAKTIHIESLTLQEMTRKDFTGALISYMDDVAREGNAKRALLPGAACKAESKVLAALDEDAGKIVEHLEKLKEDTEKAEQIAEIQAQASFYQEVVLGDMSELRACIDHAEALIPDSYLPYPTYGEVLFSLR